jgi:hypothetical protein
MAHIKITFLIIFLTGCLSYLPLMGPVTKKNSKKTIINIYFTIHNFDSHGSLYIINLEF